MNINQCAQATGVSKDTLRYYDQEGILSPARDANQYRNYSTADVTRLNIIQNLKYAGLSLVEIKMITNLMDAPITDACKQDTIAFLADKRQIFQAKIQFYQALDKIAQAIQTGAETQDFANVKNLIQSISQLPLPDFEVR
ncbi:MAG: MerR family transcriptional regulator [Lactobacillus sp.]|jgi:DNA-binding transcriptional MerR regulator|nr:MerR family transcriptional regulator [Lactobacillus sp.]